MDNLGNGPWRRAVAATLVVFINGAHKTTTTNLGGRAPWPGAILPVVVRSAVKGVVNHRRTADAQKCHDFHSTDVALLDFIRQR